MIEVGAGITIGPGITLGNVPVFVSITDFVTEDGLNFLVDESNNNFIEEN
jgi:hypothetical protein